MNIRLNDKQLNKLFTTELLDKFNDISVKVYSGYFEVTSPDVDIEMFLNNFRFTINDIKTLLNTDKENTVSIYISDDMTLHLYIAPTITELSQLNKYLKLYLEHHINLNAIISYLDRYTFWYDTDKDIEELKNINLKKLNTRILQVEQGDDYCKFVFIKNDNIFSFTVVPLSLKIKFNTHITYINTRFRPLNLSLTFFNLTSKNTNEKDK